MRAAVQQHLGLAHASAGAGTSARSGLHMGEKAVAARAHGRCVTASRISVHRAAVVAERGVHREPRAPPQARAASWMRTVPTTSSGAPPTQDCATISCACVVDARRGRRRGRCPARRRTPRAAAHAPVAFPRLAAHWTRNSQGAPGARRLVEPHLRTGDAGAHAGAFSVFVLGQRRTGAALAAAGLDVAASACRPASPSRPAARESLASSRRRAPGGLPAACR